MAPFARDNNPDRHASDLALLARQFDRLVDLLDELLKTCDQLSNPSAEVKAGTNLPELLRGALETVCRNNHSGTDFLTRHRPGSWEAQLIHTLAAGVDWYPNRRD
jgi:hypothetical protein